MYIVSVLYIPLRYISRRNLFTNSFIFATFFFLSFRGEIWLALVLNLTAVINETQEAASLPIVAVAVFRFTECFLCLIFVAVPQGSIPFRSVIPKFNSHSCDGDVH